MGGVILATTLILTNGRIWTGDPAARFVEAVAIQGNRIVATGSAADIAAAHPDAERLDLGGRLAVPGFIDNHTHFIEAGLGLGSSAPASGYSAATGTNSSGNRIASRRGR